MKKISRTEEERKAINNEKARRYRERHPDRVKDSNKKSYHKNTENRKASARKYYEGHTDERRAAATAYRLAHREECIAKCKKYHSENKERLIEQGREYYKNNKEKCNFQSRNYRKTHVVQMKDYFKKKNAKDYSVFVSEKSKLKGSGCIICGYNRCDKALEFHHKDPSIKEHIVSAFRSIESMKAEAAKCIVLCSNCHRELHAGIISLDNLQEVAQ